MKNFLLATLITLLGAAALVWAQNTTTPNPQVMGRGRGGAPYAWNDKNKDGICDLTGQPVGQGRGMGMRGARAGRGGGPGRGRGGGWRCFRFQAQQQSAPAAPQAQK